MTSDKAVTIGIVLIGRNEGERLRVCLNSIVGRGLPVVYVDSGSSDSSVALARSMDVDVVQLDTSRPFSAARARNAGFTRILEMHDALQYVQFVDGDCEIVAGWPDRACTYLDNHPDVAVVCGRRRERFPERSIYNRICNIEWTGPAGDTDNCGGDAVVRSSSFTEVGGFNPSVPAGEEPELCHRIRARGWRVVRLDEEMTIHDAAMTRFSQWYRRQVRTGYGGLNVATRFGIERFRRQVRSALIWTLGYLILLLGGSFAVSLFAGARTGLVVLVALLALPFVQSARIGLRIHREKDLPLGFAFMYGVFTLLSKYVQAMGFLSYWWDRFRGKHARLIEYKDQFSVTPGATR